MFSIATAKKFAADQKARGLDAISKFQQNLAVNPHYAFTWADDAMLAAARLDVAATIERHMEHQGFNIEGLNEYAMDRALHGAANPARSSSACSNQMEVNITAVWAELAKKGFDAVRFAKKGRAMSVNKSATFIGTVGFKANDNQTSLWIGANSNDGSTIVWQKPKGGRSSRCTGRRITGLANELALALDVGAAFWVAPPATDALEALWQHRSPPGTTR